jgi:hypothetical protein
MRASKPKKRDDNYSLASALQYYRNCITQQLKNRHSVYHACTVLKMLEKRNIISTNERADLRTLAVDELAQKIMGQIGHLRPSTQKVYANTARHAIQEFLRWKATAQDQSANRNS